MVFLDRLKVLDDVGGRAGRKPPAFTASSTQKEVERGQGQVLSPAFRPAYDRPMFRPTFLSLDRRDRRSQRAHQKAHARSAGPNAAGGLWPCGEVQELPLHPFDAGKVSRDDLLAMAEEV